MIGEYKIDNSEQIDGNVKDVIFDADDMSLLYHCSVVDSLVQVDVDKSGIKTDSNECECCDSHGVKIVHIHCDCELEHNIVINCW